MSGRLAAPLFTEKNAPDARKMYQVTVRSLCKHHNVHGPLLEHLRHFLIEEANLCLDSERHMLVLLDILADLSAGRGDIEETLR